MKPRSGRVQSFKLDRRGLARVLGELEAEVMEAVWSLPEPTVAEVCEHLGDDANYKTVMTVLNRLVEKRLLARRRESRAYRYVATDEREAFLERVSRRVAEGLVQDFGPLAVASFVDALDAVEPELLEKLERLIKARQDSLSADAVDGVGVHEPWRGVQGADGSDGPTASGTGADAGAGPKDSEGPARNVGRDRVRRGSSGGEA